MVGEGQFHTALNEAASLLKQCGLLKERNPNMRSRLGAAALSGLHYSAMRDALIRVNDYDFKLEDDSLMSFWRSENGIELRYWWFESPQEVPAFEDFARRYIGNILGLEEAGEDVVEEWLAEYSPDIQAAFEDDVQSSPLRSSVTPIRYEFKPSDYTAGIHPASHLHLGNDNTIRLGCRRVLNPLSFVLMVLRQSYPDVWKGCLENGIARNNMVHVRDGLGLVIDDYWTEHDTYEMWLE